ncbi:DNA sulfur modification protein DndE [Dorea sp. D27]|uniref:DNA sulfur modification protein DndE n=1 Tax=Dorea sp. D27 TaxID=658665 RepID=UPI0006731F33|nr:DNA sulfur modification protein DndE [Dorea sp. D27]KMZ53077.1 DNA sulfur modification protein DndE [Dorea sp. D27]
MILKQIKLSIRDKDKLSRLKGKTGIQNWNVLCRWALCFSLNEPSIPVDVEQPSDSNLEMSWITFGGENYKLFESLIKARCIKDNLPTDNATLSKYFKLHLSRGISFLSGTNMIKSLDDLLLLSIDNREEGL